MEPFWDFYLQEHSRRSTRVMHFIGTTIAFVALVAAAILLNPWMLLVALVAGYLFAWLGHLIFEKNRPATFKAPLRSLAADWKMWALTLTGRLGKDLDRLGLSKGS